MCILFLAIGQHPHYPVVITANRDEFYARPTQATQFWPECPELLAGRDLQAGGSWMGIHKDGRVAALTNIRAPHRLKSDARSRGELVSNYLTAPASETKNYLARLQSSKTQYNGYNLLFGPINQLQVYNNHQDQLSPLPPGFYGLSNASLNSPWPKLNRGVARLRQYCQGNHPLQVDTLFSLLRDDTQAEDNLLPNTGVPLEWERKVSSIFIQTEDYGTRSSTIMLLDNEHTLHWHERSFTAQGNLDLQQTFHFQLNK